MKLLGGSVLLLCLIGCVLSADSETKRRLVKEPKEEAESGKALSYDSTESSERSKKEKEDAGSVEHKSEETGSHNEVGSKSTVTPGRRRKNKKGSARRNKPEVKTNREDNGHKHKSNMRANKKKLISNPKLLSRLGLRIDNKNHYRKRLAGMNEKNQLIGNNYKGHQKRILENVDSRMYVIKLPPSSHYYASHHDMNKNKIQDNNQKYNLNNLGINFNNNGKPSKIYHYNIPIINEVVGRKTNSNFFKNDDNSKKTGANQSSDSHIFNVPNLDTHAKELNHPISHEDIDIKSNHKKPYGPKKPVTYLKPKAPAKQAFMKYFPNNGKPHAFYVIENSSVPYYQRLLP